MLLPHVRIHTFNTFHLRLKSPVTVSACCVGFLWFLVFFIVMYVQKFISSSRTYHIVPTREQCNDLNLVENHYQIRYTNVMKQANQTYLAGENLSSPLTVLYNQLNIKSAAIAGFKPEICLTNLKHFFLYYSRIRYLSELLSSVEIRRQARLQFLTANLSRSLPPTRIHIRLHLRLEPIKNGLQFFIIVRCLRFLPGYTLFIRASKFQLSLGCSYFPRFSGLNAL